MGKWAEIEGQLGLILARGDCTCFAQLAIDGEGLKKLGMKEGPDLGRTLHWLLDQVLEDPALNTKEQLTNLVKGAMIT